MTTFPLGEEDIIPGISSRGCPYHTPGCSAFILRPENGDPLYYAGDCVGIESLTVNNQCAPACAFLSIAPRSFCLLRAYIVPFSVLFWMFSGGEYVPLDQMM